MIIGLTGKNGSGKGEAAAFLRTRGFQYRSLSDVVRTETRKRRKTVTRQNLIETGNALRHRYGDGVLAERLVSTLDRDGHYVVDSIRHPGEIKVLRRFPEFILIHIAAPQKVRFRRLKSRGRESDPKTFRDFRRLEAVEGKSHVKSDQQLNRAIRMASDTITNAGTVDKLHEKVVKLIMKTAKSLQRPSWDDYFMGIAKVVALRSNCIKRKVAAIIVKDRRIISTGYNGTPRGVKNCSEGGCPRCNSFASSGTRLEECLCSHGEENAITQASYHGVNINKAMLYSTFSPCLLCTKLIINSGIKEVVFNADYPLAGTALKLLKEAKVHVRRLRVL